MRDVNAVIKPVVDALTTHPGHDLERSQLEDLCRVEAGLWLIETLMPDTSAMAGWALFSGHPFVRTWASSMGLPDDAMLRAARHTLLPFQQRSVWNEALTAYRAAPAALRGYDLTLPDGPPERRRPPTSPGRWETYRHLLEQAPPFAPRGSRPAGSGLHSFPAGRTTAHVELPLLTVPAPSPHDLRAGRANRGPVRFSYKELLATAAEMDARHPNAWVDRIDRIRWSGRKEHDFSDTVEITVDGIQHLVCRERGALHTLRDVITVHMAREHRGRATVIVGDEGEVLRLVRLYNIHTGGAAAPVLALPGRALHIERANREQFRRSGRNPLAYQGSAFDYLSTSCALNELRTEPGTNTPVAFGEAPCHTLRPVSAEERPYGERTCPMWAACPRHRADRALVGADIWVASPTGLLEVSPHPAQNTEDVRLLEVACRRSDLVLVSHADHVQQALDRAFAPARSLVGGRHEFLEELHERQRLTGRGRQRPAASDRHTDMWSGALDLSRTAAGKVYDLLTELRALSADIDFNCFSAHSVQQRLVEHARPRSAAAVDAELAKRLDDFRADPFDERRPPASDRPHSELTSLLYDLLHRGDPRNTRARLARAVERLLAPKAEPHERVDALAARFELFLLLSALETLLARLVDTWRQADPVVRAGFNPLAAVPDDFRPMVPEPPMGEVLGFRFSDRGARGAELSFFRCLGVGRELLTGLHRLPEVDGLPRGNVLLMSGTGWAGSATKAHLPVQVGVVAEPRKRPARCMVRHEGELAGPAAVLLSGGAPEERTVALRRAVTVLGASEEEGAIEGGPLERQLMVLPDGRDHLLMIVSSYDEAREVADTLHNQGERWHDRVLRLVRDDDASTPGTEASTHGARILPRCDLHDFRNRNADVLVAPLNAFHPQHRVLNRFGTGAFGAVYFLSCPGHFARDPEGAVNSVNSWLTRAAANGEFTTWMQASAGLQEGLLALRQRAEQEWQRLLGRGEAWSELDDDDRSAASWDLFVSMARIVGLAQDGGEAVQVVLVDSAFAPGRHQSPPRPDTARSSRLRGMFDALQPYFDAARPVDPHDRFVARSLYQPLWTGLSKYMTGLGE
ncbi:hypothetical protein ACFCXT_35055 [Streptomyces vinaceus]|uniref:pPIWI_RE_Z domain-containing protein n=1 Tax=Streptomyces vinaceus TaxID=1960 RepID=UPI0035D7AE22